jgi:arylsulfatase A-like enzyme
LGSAALTIGRSARAIKKAPKPNLLVFLPDQLRVDTVIGDGAQHVHAPNIHALASESVVFERTYVTQPICAPARSSILCGRWPHQTGCIRNQTALPRSFACLPEMLQDAEYRTGYFGKWHLGDEALPQRGFQEWISTEEYGKSAARGKSKKIESDYTRFLLSKGYDPEPRNGQTFGRSFVSSLPFELSKPRFLELMACDFLERHRDEPFVLFVAFYEPHPPYNGPFNDEHPLQSITLDASVTDTLGDDVPLRYRLLQERFRKQAPTEAAYSEIKQKYLGLVTEIDYSVGAILAKLTELGLRDNTITVLTSDHGDMMSGHGLLDKMVMFEQATRVPFLVRAPNVAPRRYAAPVSQIDFTPTMLDLLGKPPHEQCVGRSKAGIVRGEIIEPEHIFLQWSPTKELMRGSKLASRDDVARVREESTRAVVSSDGWKLCLRDKDKNELYNFRDDPDEQHNLYYRDGHTDVVFELTNRIHRWQEQFADHLKV